MDLGSLLHGLGVRKDPRVLVGFATSDDAGVFRLTEDLALVQTVDFITPVCDDPFGFGQVAAANPLSDVYAMGGRPVTALNVCCFPRDGVPEGVFSAILEGGLSKLDEAGASLLGGHTVKDDELKYGLAVTGVIDPRRIMSNAGARPGDVLILTKPLGTGILIGALRKGRAPAGAFQAAMASMTRLNAGAAEAAVAGGARAATDVTGFGLGGHALLMARGSGVGLRIRASSLPVLPEVAALIESGVATGMASSNRSLVEGSLGVDPAVAATLESLVFDPQTSGGLLLSVPEARAEALLRELRSRGDTASECIGEVFESGRPMLDVAP